MTLIGSLVCLIGIVKKTDSEMKSNLNAMTKENRQKIERTREKRKDTLKVYSSMNRRMKEKEVERRKFINDNLV